MAFWLRAFYEKRLLAAKGICVFVRADVAGRKTVEALARHGHQGMRLLLVDSVSAISQRHLSHSAESWSAGIIRTAPGLTRAPAFPVLNVSDCLPELKHLGSALAFEDFLTLRCCASILLVRFFSIPPEIKELQSTQGNLLESVAGLVLSVFCGTGLVVTVSMGDVCSYYETHGHGWGSFVGLMFLKNSTPSFKFSSPTKYFHPCGGFGRVGWHT
jgi:hypothetical protein